MALEGSYLNRIQGVAAGILGTDLRGERISGPRFTSTKDEPTREREGASKQERGAAQRRRKEAETVARKSERRLSRGREIPAVRLARRFRAARRRQRRRRRAASSSTRNEGEVVGREVAVPRGRRSTDCNVARNYVSAVSTADIPPPPAPRRWFALHPLHMHPSATAAAGISACRDCARRAALFFPDLLFYNPANDSYP